MVKTLEDCQALAAAKGGECLATKYVLSMTKMLWRCAEGHEWETTYAAVQTGYWCSDCNIRVYNLQDCVRRANENGGQCLSTEYKNVNVKMSWQCDYMGSSHRVGMTL